MATSSCQPLDFIASSTVSGATPWFHLLIAFDAVYLALGAVVYGPIQEST